MGFILHGPLLRFRMPFVSAKRGLGQAEETLRPIDGVYIAMNTAMRPLHSKMPVDMTYGIKQARLQMTSYGICARRVSRTTHGRALALPACAERLHVVTDLDVQLQLSRYKAVAAPKAACCTL
jgi:hypothetical protein